MGLSGGGGSVAGRLGGSLGGVGSAGVPGGVGSAGLASCPRWSCV